jgi:hypothetical protein
MSANIPSLIELRMDFLFLRVAYSYEKPPSMRIARVSA